jgi:hypothetical protein
MSPALSKYVVLVGAGLSRNWGGYLASEMWAAILSQPTIQGTDRLRRLLLRQTNFEVALAEVESDDEGYSPEERAAMRDAVRAAFGEHDDNLRHVLGTNPGRTLWLTFFDLVIRPLIDGHVSKAGGSILFSLNQDLMLERAMPRVSSRSPPNMAGLNLPPDPWFPNIPDRPHLGDLKANDVVVVPNEVPTDIIFPDRLNLVKLHGSINWRTLGPDGNPTDVLVLGGGKAAAIDRFPLLRSYHHILRSALMAGGVRLLVVGYGFGDEHINKVIRVAAETKQLGLFVVDQKSPEDLRSTLERIGIWSCLIGCMHRRIDESFTAGSTIGRSGEARRIFDHFFLA